MSPSAFEEFGRLEVIFTDAIHVLDELLRVGALEEEGRRLLAGETLPHIDQVEAGFKAALRSSSTSLDELRHLVAAGGLGLPEPRDDAEARAALIEAMQALSGAGGPRVLETAAGGRLTALEHARLALALVPRMPPDDVRFPGRRSYADIAAPEGPSAFMARVEEIERSVWEAAIGGRARPVDERWRRVYAFFDAGERLARPSGWKV
jgi:hypothetical protein